MVTASLVICHRKATHTVLPDVRNVVRMDVFSVTPSQLLGKREAHWALLCSRHNYRQFHSAAQ